jgi:hypothetical protein
VAQGVTDRGSAIALLELIYGFSNSEASSLLGSVEEGDLSEPTTTGQPSAPKASTEQFQDTGNDALRGLSAKENQDIMRIIRDHAKGRLNEEIAKARLMAYGIDEETITKTLTA